MVFDSITTTYLSASHKTTQPIAPRNTCSCGPTYISSTSLPSPSTISSYTGFYINTGRPPNRHSPALPYSTQTFPRVPHPVGHFTLTTTYLTQPNFRLDELESLLSSGLLSLDNGGPGGDFVPTLERNRQRDSITSSPGSLAVRTSLPASPPTGHGGLGLPGAGTSGSLADRMAMMRQQGGYAGLSGMGSGTGVGGGQGQGHAHPRTTSFPTVGGGGSPRVVPSPLPMSSRAVSAQGEREYTGAGSAVSLASSRRSATSTGTGEGGVGGYAASPSRLRKESTSSLAGRPGVVSLAPVWATRHTVDYFFFLFELFCSIVIYPQAVVLIVPSTGCPCLTIIARSFNVSLSQHIYLWLSTCSTPRTQPFQVFHPLLVALPQFTINLRPTILPVCTPTITGPTSLPTTTLQFPYITTRYPSVIGQCDFIAYEGKGGRPSISCEYQ